MRGNTAQQARQVTKMGTTMLVLFECAAASQRTTYIEQDKQHSNREHRGRDEVAGGALVDQSVVIRQLKPFMMVLLSRFHVIIHAFVACGGGGAVCGHSNKWCMQSPPSLLCSWLPSQSNRMEHLQYLIDDHGIIDGGRDLGNASFIRQLLHRRSKHLAASCLGQALHHSASLQRSDRAHLLSDLGDHFRGQHLLADAFLGGGLREDNQRKRDFSLERVANADHCTLGDMLVGGDHLLHLACRQPMASHVDDIIRAGKDVDVSIFIDEAFIAGLRRG